MGTRPARRPRAFRSEKVHRVKLPLKFERLPEYVEAERLGVRKLNEWEGYPRENDGSWIITDADGVGVIVVRMQAKAKRGHGYNTPDPDGMRIARLIVRAVNKYT